MCINQDHTGIVHLIGHLQLCLRDELVLEGKLGEGVTERRHKYCKCTLTVQRTLKILNRRCTPVDLHTTLAHLSISLILDLGVNPAIANTYSVKDFIYECKNSEGMPTVQTC